MNILVTGGLGAIGSWIVRAAVGMGHKPVVFDAGADTRLISDLDVQVVHGSVVSVPDVVDVIRKHRVEAVIHAAALMPPECAAHPDRAVEVNVNGALAVFQASRLEGLGRVVAFSSKGVYGEVPPPHCHPDYVPLPETARLAPDSIYGATKVMVERLAAEFSRRYGMSIVCLRLATTFGPGKGRHGILSLHSQVIDAGRAGRPLMIPQGSEESCDLVFNGDVGRAAVLAALAESPRYALYHVGTGQPTCFGDFVAWVKATLPQAEVRVGPGLNYMRREHPTYCVLDVNRAREDFGFRAEAVGPRGIAAYLEAVERMEKAGSSL